MNRKPLLTLTLLLLFLLLASTVMAQDSTPEATADPDSIVDQEVEEAVILKREVTPDGIHTIVQVPNKKDTYIASNRPDQNFGLQPDMRLGYSNNVGGNLGAMRLLLQYQVQEYVPQGAVVNSATLNIFLTGVTPAGDSSMGFKALYLTSDWSEKTVTWNNHQPQWGSEIGLGSASSSLGWHQADVTQMVREWIDGGRTNYGFTVIGDEAIQDRQRVYATKDANNGLSSYVVVDFNQSVDTTPPVANVKSLPQWSPSNFRVEWEGYDPNNPNGSSGSGIRWYDVWDSTNSGTNWNIWRAQVTSTSATFEGGQHLVKYSFTARAVDNAGNTQSRDGVQASTTVDAQAPVVSMNPLSPITTSDDFTISWGGTDSGSGIASYDVQWRVQGQAWQWLFENTTLTSFNANGGQDGVTYEFRARGTDKVGNTQAWTNAQTSTTIVLAPYSTVTATDPHPILQIKDGPSPGQSFRAFWEGHTAPGTTPLTYDVYVRAPGENWTLWLDNTALTSENYVLKVNDPDGTYYFEVTARNNLGQQEQPTGVPENYIIVDRNPPFIEPQIWMPAIFNP